MDDAMTVAALVAEIDGLREAFRAKNRDASVRIEYVASESHAEAKMQWQGWAIEQDEPHECLGPCIYATTAQGVIAGLRKIVDDIGAAPHIWSPADVAATLGLPICAWCDEAPATHDSHDDHYAPLGSRPERVCEPCLERAYNRQVERAMEG